MKNLIVVFVLLFGLDSCSEQPAEEPVVAPTNLQVNVVLDESGSGKVDVSASATNANFYSIYFGVNANESPMITSTGQATFTYPNSGNFNIRVKAHATASVFIEKQTDVTVQLNMVDGIRIPTTGYDAPTTYPGYTLAWQDDFSGATLNSAFWSHEVGRGNNGWGNNELQYYQPNNTIVKDGLLIISAKKEFKEGAEYTSSRIITKDKKSFQYGRIDIRAALPKGKGIWPAFWMLGANFSTVGWPKCGELDIMELVGGGVGDRTVYGTLHWDNAGQHACTCGDDGYTLASGTFYDKFHVFSAVWTSNKVSWYVDNVLFHEIDTTPSELSEFDAPFFFIFNIAVGGNWPGNPDASTVFPQHLIVDYIRVYQ
ncbi:MAG: glycoside hydrolase family 16 protein [Cyclobacteriaceae bacterium]|jgi:beta-glucanase (GH16 family)|nr:glycoside hydrolase family 16 protein [Cyclobacteriaceae bacterium]